MSEDAENMFPVVYGRLLREHLWNTSPRFIELLDDLRHSPDILELPATYEYVNDLAGYERLREAFRTLKEYADEHFNVEQKEDLRERLRGNIENLMLEVIEGENKAEIARDITKPLFRSDLQHEDYNLFYVNLHALVATETDQYQPCKAYLYGAFVRGVASPRSYIELAIVSDGFSGMEHPARVQLLKELTGRRHSFVKPIGLTPKEFGEGKVLSESHLLFMLPPKREHYRKKIQRAILLPRIARVISAWSSVPQETRVKATHPDMLALINEYSTFIVKLESSAYTLALRSSLEGLRRRQSRKLLDSLGVAEPELNDLVKAIVKEIPLASQTSRKKT